MLQYCTKIILYKNFKTNNKTYISQMDDGVSTEQRKTMSTCFIFHVLVGKYNNEIPFIQLENQLTSDSHPRKSILYNGPFFNIYGACKAIDVDTRREVVIKTGKTNANNRAFSISQEPTVQYFLKSCIFSTEQHFLYLQWTFFQYL